ncbi:MAG: alpha/beta fold hydrolase [Gammaproteobacteria bacterium]|nr:alpha/beta fold hydrolase [Gammaproteobacteria bacterium]
MGADGPDPGRGGLPHPQCRQPRPRRLVHAGDLRALCPGPGGGIPARARRGAGCPPSVVIGHSMGGAIAEEYAIAHREDVRALVLVASAGGASGPEREDLSEDMEALRAACNEAAWRPCRSAGGQASGRGGTDHRHPTRDAAPGVRPDQLRRLRVRRPGAAHRRDTLNDLATLDLPTLVGPRRARERIADAG